jgi:hypothetical protein
VLQADSMFTQFHLAGGTGLAMQLGHRLSIDLDLFSLSPFDSEFYLEYLENKYQFALDYSSTNTLKGSIGNIKIDFISHQYHLLLPIIKTEKVRLYSECDIAAMKISAITVNGTRSKDFVDLYFLLQKYSIQQLLDFYENKYKERNTLQALKSLNYFNEVNIADWPILIKNKNITWNKMKTSIDEKCKEYIHKTLKNN